MKTITDQECEKLVDGFSGWIRDSKGWKATFVRDGKKYEAEMGETSILLDEVMEAAKKAFRNARQIA